MSAVPVDPPRRLLDVEIDGETLRVAEGATLLDACRARGVDTPTLCFAENLTPVNACRVCVVEVEGARTLVPACSRAAEDGMKVSTDTERVRHSRRLVMEFLASSVEMDLADADVHRWMAVYETDPERFGAAMEPLRAGERDDRGPGHHHDLEPGVAETVAPAGEGRQRPLRPRLLAVHPLLQVRRGVRRRRSEHVRDRRRRPRVRRPHLDGVRGAARCLGLCLLRELHRRVSRPVP